MTLATDPSPRRQNTEPNQLFNQRRIADRDGKQQIRPLAQPHIDDDVDAAEFGAIRNDTGETKDTPLSRVDYGWDVASRVILVTAVRLRPVFT
jgi:hypothetical protein